MSALATKSTGSSSGLRGTGYRQITSPTLSKEQQGLFSQLLSGAQPGISKGLGQLSSLAGGDQQAFGQLEAPALRQFGALQGNLASRFSGGLGQGGTGLRRSSGFQNTMSGEASDLAERLQSQRLGLQQNAIRELLGLGESLLGTKTFDTSFIEKRKKRMPWWQQLLGGGSGLAGAGLGAAFGGFPGAKLGSKIGSSFGQSFFQ